ncbi:MAG: hypothetical protein M5U28_39760 [Sandaracinaceae bacterium]|nr:hypothetical protein [Sandaracinaceae bacterium]
MPELTTAADSIATRIFHAIGYSTPCNQVVMFTPTTSASRQARRATTRVSR